MPRPPDMTDFDAWMRDVHARIADDRHDWNSMALGFLVARGADYRVTDDWELLSAFTCGDKPRAEAAIAVATRAWLAHDWCDRCGYRAPYRASFVDAARDNDPPADVDVAAWVRSLDDAAWEAARAATPTGRGGNAIGDEDSLAIWAEKTKTGAMSPRRGDKWEAFKKQNAGKVLLTPKEEAEARELADALRRHERAAEMLYGGGTELHPEIEWHYNGRKFVSHLDAYRKGAFVIDVKTARDGDPSRFSRTAIWSHYHTQLAMYVTAVESLGHPTPDAYLIVVEKGGPTAVTVMRLSARALERGRAQFHAWFERLQQCESAGFWPAYAQDVVELDIPDTDEPFAGLTYQGEDIEI